MLQPVSIYIDCFGTEKVELEKIADRVKNNFDLCPQAIIDRLDLRRPVFQDTAAYGHFGRGEFNWERLDSADMFKSLL